MDDSFLKLSHGSLLFIRKSLSSQQAILPDLFLAILSPQNLQPFTIYHSQKLS